MILQASTGPTAEVEKAWGSRRFAITVRTGLCPIPLRGKKPYKKDWTDPAKYQGVDVEEVLRMFEPDNNVGLLASEIPLKNGQYTTDQSIMMILDYGISTVSKSKSEGRRAMLAAGAGWNCSHWLTCGSITMSLSDDPGKFVFQGHNGTSHGGEVQGAGTQCVAPPSIHPDTKGGIRMVL